MATKQERLYKAKINELLLRQGRLDAAHIKTTKRLLEDARKALILDLIDVTPETWNEFHLLQLKNATEIVIVDFRIKYKLELFKMNIESWDLGRDFTNEPIKIMEPEFLIKSLDLTALETAQTATSDLVTGLSQEAIKNINSRIQLGIMGQKTPFAIMGEIGRNLTDPSVFGTIAIRAETITRTETSRIQNISSEISFQQAADEISGLKKEWIWSGKSRKEHARAHGQIVPPKGKFIVGGEKLRFPLDPAGSAKNTINCGCTVVAFKEGWPTLEEINPELWKDAQEHEKDKEK